MYFFDVVFEATQRPNFSAVDHDVFTKQPSKLAALDFSVGHIAAPNSPDLRDGEHLPDFRTPQDMLFVLGVHQACHGSLDLADNVVNHVVKPDIYILFNSQVADLRVGSDVESNDHGIGNCGQHDI